MYSIYTPYELHVLENLSPQVYGRAWTELNRTEQDDLYCFWQNMEYIYTAFGRTWNTETECEERT